MAGSTPIASRRSCSTITSRRISNFYRAEPDAAKQIATKYAEHPVERWREAFANVVAQADEIAKNEVVVVDEEDRDQNQARRAAQTPSLDFVVEARTVKLDYQNLASVRVNYYLMDVELLFSRNPFVQNHGGRFSFIRPNQTQTIELPRTSGISSSRCRRS